MGTAERRHEILKVLSRRRHETITNLAEEFQVSRRTIQRDIDALSLSVPIYTKTGCREGGVYMINEYSMDKLYMSEAELSVLRKLENIVAMQQLLTSGEREVLAHIIKSYTMPGNKKGNG